VVQLGGVRGPAGGGSGSAWLKARLGGRHGVRMNAAGGEAEAQGGEAQGANTDWAAVAQKMQVRDEFRRTGVTRSQATLHHRRSA